MALFGYTQKVISNISGISHSTVHTVCAGKNTPKLDTMAVLYDVFRERINADWFFTGTGSMLKDDKNQLLDLLSKTETKLRQVRQAEFNET